MTGVMASTGQAIASDELDVEQSLSTGDPWLSVDALSLDHANANCAVASVGRAD